MKPTHTLILTAFLNALTKLDQPLPGEIQTKLHELVETLKANPTDIGKLSSIAKGYKLLDDIYHQEWEIIEKNVGERNKGLPPLPLDKEPTRELINDAIDTFSAPDSVAKAKAKVKPNLLQRIWQFIPGTK